MPGPTHVDTVHTLTFESNRKNAILGGVWASLPLDFIAKITGKGDLRVELVRQFPAPLEHLLTRPLLLRTLRLNCLTADYAPLWQELYDEAWLVDRWADPEWERTPLE